MFRHYLGQSLFAAGLLAVLWTIPAAAEAPVFEADEYSRDMADTGQESSSTVTSAAPPETTSSQQGADMSGGEVSTNDDDATSPALTQGQRIDRLEQQMDNLQHSENGKKINHFQEELQFLRGKVDELTHQLEQLQARQQTMYTDLDRRVTAPKSLPTVAVQEPSVQAPTAAQKKPLNVPAAASKAASTTKVTAQPNVAEEQQTYQLAYDLIKAEKYDQAVNTLQKMLHKYPSGPFAANAHYWLGELYGLQGKNALSATEFQTVLKQYPNSPRLADAGLKLGLIFAAELKWHEAKSAFHNVINRYPGTASARLASEQLKQIKQSGH